MSIDNYVAYWLSKDRRDKMERIIDTGKVGVYVAPRDDIESEILDVVCYVNANGLPAEYIANVAHSILIWGCRERINISVQSATGLVMAHVYAADESSAVNFGQRIKRAADYILKVHFSALYN